MKTSQLAAPAAALFAMSLVLTSPNTYSAEQPGDPAMPVGSLSAYPTVVRIGTFPTLTWSIMYPESIPDILIIPPPASGGGIVTTVTTTTKICALDVRMVGGSYQVGTDDNGQPIFGWIDAQVRADGATSWSRFIYDTPSDINPTSNYYSEEVRKGYNVDFRARVHNGTNWLPYVSTDTATPQLLVLFNGDSLPSGIPAFEQGQIDSSMVPYVGSDGRVNIGPKDALYLFELNTNNPSRIDFDYQDLMLLVTFNTQCNGGHGNNIDGVDSSNPGTSKPDDPSVDYDDEIK